MRTVKLFQYVELFQYVSDAKTMLFYWRVTCERGRESYNWRRAKEQNMSEIDIHHHELTKPL